MFINRNNSKWAKLAAIAVVAVIALVMVSGMATAASNCKNVNGKLVLNADTTGSYSGDLRGTSAFTADGLPSDTGVDGVLLLTGTNMITTDDGTLTTRDAIVLRSAEPGEFAEVDIVINGTGAWTGATGVIQATGKFIFGVGGTGDYIGEICTP